jgi:hypothetical protein
MYKDFEKLYPQRVHDILSSLSSVSKNTPKIIKDTKKNIGVLVLIADRHCEL